MQPSLYHQQTITKSCKYCGRGFIGHPNRDYCSYRCKRKAKESRYRTIAANESIPQTGYDHEYDVVTPQTAATIFEFLEASKQGAVTVVDFMEPEQIIVPASVTISYNGKIFFLFKLPPDNIKPSSRPLFEELSETSPLTPYKP